MPGASHQIPRSLVLSHGVGVVCNSNALLCTMYTYMCVLAFKCLIFTHTCTLSPPFPFSFSFSFSLSLSLSFYTCTHTHKYLDRCTHTSIVHDELNDILNLLLVLVSFTLLPWTLATTPWMVNCEGQGWVLLQRRLDSIH